MSWAQITFSRFAISVWQQERGSARQGTGQSCPCAERPDTMGRPFRQGHPPGGADTPFPITTQAATGCRHLAPRAAAQLQGAETPREGPGKLIPNTTPSKNIRPASSMPTLRAPGWLLPPPCQQHGAPWPLAPRATPQPLHSLPLAPLPLIAALPAAGSPGELLSLQLLFFCNTQVPKAIRSSAGRESSRQQCSHCTHSQGLPGPMLRVLGGGTAQALRHLWPHRHIPGENPRLRGQAPARAPVGDSRRASSGDAHAAHVQSWGPHPAERGQRSAALPKPRQGVPRAQGAKLRGAPCPPQWGGWKSFGASKRLTGGG